MDSLKSAFSGITSSLSGITGASGPTSTADVGATDTNPPALADDSAMTDVKGGGLHIPGFGGGEKAEKAEKAEGENGMGVKVANGLADVGGFCFTGGVATAMMVPIGELLMGLGLLVDVAAIGLGAAQGHGTDVTAKAVHGVLPLPGVESGTKALIGLVKGML